MSHVDQCQSCSKRGLVSACIGCPHNDREHADAVGRIAGVRLPSGAEMAQRARKRTEESE
jgi:hypothetical protein